jgi:hypothetical protein
MTRKISLFISLIVFGAVGALGYQWLESRYAAEIYRDQLVELNDDYHDLAEDYNQAVTRTAVTELVVDGDRVRVTVRTADGRVETHPVSADPSLPIYVDYVVKDGRLLIRRVFDSSTAPDGGTPINSELLAIDWNDPAVKHGKAVYRELSNGRWIVTVSGDGSLGLSKVDQNTLVELTPAPSVAEFDPVDHAKQKIGRVGPIELLGRLLGGGSD